MVRILFVCHGNTQRRSSSDHLYAVRPCPVFGGCKKPGGKAELFSHRNPQIDSHEAAGCQQDSGYLHRRDEKSQQK